MSGEAREARRPAPLSRLIVGDCRRVLPKFRPNSFDSIVTDPPYGIRFSGAAWDCEVPPVAVWRRCLRVLKPGGYLIAFGGTRTYHRLATNVEDAGFDIRDMVTELYEMDEYARRFFASLTSEQIKLMLRAFGVDALIGWVYGSGFPKSANIEKALARAGAGDVVERFRGLGTVLKPALEPIVCARKPLDGGLASNLLKHGTGAVQADRCRVSPEDSAQLSPAGRYPANLILSSDSPAVEASFPKSRSGKPGFRRTSGSGYRGGWKADNWPMVAYGDEGTASRFFYCAKARGKSRRGGDNPHPTVKPVELIRYLIRLFTPAGGLVLDPFMGSGPAAVASRLEGMGFVGIERVPKYVEHARRWAAGAVE